MAENVPLGLTITALEDFSFAGANRKSARVVIDSQKPTNEQLEDAAITVWELKGEGTDKFVVWLYLPRMDYQGVAFATVEFSRDGLESLVVNEIAALDLDGPNCLEFNKYHPEVYRYDWFDANGEFIGESTGSLLDKIVWRNPVDGRLVAFDPEPGEPFSDESAATGHYFEGPNCDNSGEHRSGYFYQERIVSREALDDPVCIQHPIVVDGETFYGFTKTGEVEFRYMSERLPIALNPEKKCQNWRSDTTVELVQGHLVEADIQLPPGPYTRKARVLE